MKKVICMFLAIICGITSVMFGFSWLKKPTKTANASVFSEEELIKKDIINPTNLNSSQSVDAIKNESLFDTKNKKIREGNVIVPKTQTNNNIYSSYDISENSFSLTDSVYVWIFIPNAIYNNLTISFENGSGNYLKWTLDDSKLSSDLRGINISDIYYGWRLFEFPVDMAETDDFIGVIDEAKFNKFNISYSREGGTLTDGSANKFMFYHLYSASKFSNDISIVGAQSYACYSIKDNYFATKNYFIDEEIVFTDIRDIFDYFIIGSTNIYQNISTNYSWDIKLIEPNDDEHDLWYESGSKSIKYIFDMIGSHKLEVRLYENRILEKNVPVFYYSTNISVNDFVIGAFSGFDYKFKVNEKNAITFNISSYFKSNGDIIVELEDQDLANVSYYIKDGIIYIELEGLKKGETKINIKATALKPGLNQVLDFSCSADVEFEDIAKKPSSEVFLWVVLGVYGVGFTIFVVISLVKARRVSVK